MPSDHEKSQSSKQSPKATSYSRHALETGELEAFFLKKVLWSDEWFNKQSEVKITPFYSAFAPCKYNKKNNDIVICTPVVTDPSISALTGLPFFNEVIDSIKKSFDATSQPTFSGILMGFDSLNHEPHYVAFHINKLGKTTIFDSKLINAEKFLNDSFDLSSRLGAESSNQPQKSTTSLLTKISVVRFLHEEVKAIQFGSEAINNHTDCGYHAAGAIGAIVEYLGRDSNRDGLEDVVEASKNKHLEIAVQAFNSSESYSLFEKFASFQKTNLQVKLGENLTFFKSSDDESKDPREKSNNSSQSPKNSRD